MFGRIIGCYQPQVHQKLAYLHLMPKAISNSTPELTKQFIWSFIWLSFKKEDIIEQCERLQRNKEIHGEGHMIGV